MSKKLVALISIMTLICVFAQAVFADIARPSVTETAGGLILVVLLIAVIAVAAVMIIRRIRKGR